MNAIMQTRLDTMKTNLSLTPDQVAQVSEIMNAFLQNRKQLKQGNDMDKLQEARKAMKQSVENIFTADQKTKYEMNKSQYWQVQETGENDEDDNAKDSTGSTN